MKREVQAMLGGKNTINSNALLAQGLGWYN